MTRDDFEGIPETNKSQDVKLIGIEYEDKAARRRAEYAIQDKYDLDLIDAPRMTLFCRGEREELDQALEEVEEGLGEDGELYVFEEESETPERGFEQIGEDQFRYEESFPGSEEGEVQVGANGYFFGRSDLQPVGTEGRMTDGDNYVDCEVTGSRNPEVTLEFESNEEFAGRHSKAFSEWMEETLNSDSFK
jgi:hypothetical protein